jgi:hypothetical protein
VVVDPSEKCLNVRIVDLLRTPAPADICFEVAADVERWPEILSHYRWVKFRRKDGLAKGLVEMAAWRPFPGFGYPTWWLSEMEHDTESRTVTYTHVGGITKGMDVWWEVIAEGDQTLLRIVHEWSGPKWPIIGEFAADYVIGPHFVHVIASRTLAGIAAEAERRSA